jgi:NAD+ diphosphatase
MSGRGRDPASGWAIAFSGQRVLLWAEGEALRLPTEVELREALGDAALEAAAVPTALRVVSASGARAYALPEGLDPPRGWRLEGLRAAYHVIPLEEFRAAGTARQKVEWYRTHGFCSRCGTPTRPHGAHEAMACPACERLQFPVVAPAVIVLVQRGPEALLGRSERFTPGVYSTIAGFVEPGETLEECVHREVEEETGVRVENLRYFGSQPHPFPNSLMVGFVADWRDGEIRVDPTELEDARWFTADDLPELPHPMSIARALIDDFVRRTRR